MVWKKNFIELWGKGKGRREREESEGEGKQIWEMLTLREFV